MKPKDAGPTDLDTLRETFLKSDAKFIVISGGVCSSIGKGVLISSIGALLKHAGASVSVVKWDPYLNVDPGTMSPLVHGEVFVTDDGAETDLDLGHYERTLGMHLTKESSVSSGQIFQTVLEGEREGRYLGKCIQLIPHVVEEIKKRALTFALNAKASYVLVEIGGTVGDMEGEIFLEALRQLRMELGSARMLHCHLSYVPYLAWANEVKTKPTQHSVMLLKRAGLVPDCIFLRLERDIGPKTIKKVATMCGVEEEFIFTVPTRTPTFRLFLDFQEQRVAEKIQSWFGVKKPKTPDLSSWEALIDTFDSEKPKVTIALIAKYVGSSEPYISVVEAIKSAGYATDQEVEIVIIEADKLEDASSKAWGLLKTADGVVIPGGFDKRGIEGKIKAVQWAREQNVPFFGLCLGLQVMLIESARSLLGLKGAGSTEIEKQLKDPVISLLEEQEGVNHKGASMRLGVFLCSLVPGTVAQAAYGMKEVKERHRHRYEFNNAYKKPLEEKGYVFSGMYKEKNLVEIAELKGHRFMLGTQFHPEFLSTPLTPHPLFLAFLKAIKGS